MVINNATLTGTRFGDPGPSEALSTQSFAPTGPGSPIDNAASGSDGMTVSSPSAGDSASTAAQAGAANAISFTQTQAAYLQRIGANLEQMGRLSLSAQDPAKTDDGRASLDQEYQSLGTYINGVAAKDFNGVSLFNGSTVAIGATDGGGDSWMAGIDLNDAAYQAATSADISTLGGGSEGAVGASASVQAARQQLTAHRATVANNESILSRVSDQPGNGAESPGGEGSGIQDASAALAGTDFALAGILGQAGATLAAHGQHEPQAVFQLLQ
jgi:flagellin-like hook-associated protein FlgL